MSMPMGILGVKPTVDDNVSQEKAEKIYSAFWIGVEGKIPGETFFPVMNVYSKKGAFQFQLDYGQDGKFHRHHVEAP